MKKKKKRKKHSTLIRKIVLCFTILEVVLCLICMAIGYKQYLSYILGEHERDAYVTAGVFLEYCSDGTLIQYLRLVRDYSEGAVGEEEVEATVQSEEYQELSNLLELLRENVNASDIYVVWLDAEQMAAYDGETDDWAPFHYVFDSSADPEQSLSFGDTGAFDPDYIEKFSAIIETGERSDSSFAFYNESFGFDVTVFLPVLDGEEVAGLIGVEMPVSVLMNATMDYVLRLIGGVVLGTVVCILFCMRYLSRNLIGPLNLISREASSFVRNNNQISEKLVRIHTMDELQTLSESLLKMETDINQYIVNLTKVTAEKEKISTELDVAAQIQADMLPGVFPPFPEKTEFDIFASMNPAREVGGDFYDFFLVDEDHLAMVIGDVSGKSVSAALFMVIAKTLIKNETQMGHSPQEVMEAVNNQLCENNKAQMFVTVWLGVLELSTGKLTAVNAGHEYPALKRAGSSFETLDDCHGFVVGVMEDIPQEQYELKLNAGDSILIYTDGAPDAENEAGGQFSRERILEVLNRDPDQEPEELLKQIKQEIDSFVGEAEQFDDITMLCLTYHGKGGKNE